MQERAPEREERHSARKRTASGRHLPLRCSDHIDGARAPRPYAFVPTRTLVRSRHCRRLGAGQCFGRPVTAMVAVDPDELEDFVLAHAPKFARLRRAAEALLRTGRARPADEYPDVKPPGGAAPWHRLRVREYRVLCRSVAPAGEAETEVRWLVARVVHRRDLERAVTTLT